MDTSIGRKLFGFYGCRAGGDVEKCEARIRSKNSLALVQWWLRRMARRNGMVPGRNRSRCVRLFEEGVGFIATGKLLQQDNSNENNALLLGYVIFQQPDSLYAELFFPHLPSTIVCHKTSSVSGEKVWISGDYRVHQISNSRYYITHFGETIYTKD